MPAVDGAARATEVRGRLTWPSHLRLFSGACLDRKLGRIWVDDPDRPTAALLDAEYAFLAGDPSGAERLLPEIPPYQITHVRGPELEALLRRAWGGELRAKTRWSMSGLHVSVASAKRLERSLPEGFRLERVDANNIGLARGDQHVCLTQQFEGPEDFLRRGVGFCIRDETTMASLAASILVVGHAIEVAVATDLDHRGRGFATAAGAALLSFCKRHALRPDWDAANPASLRIAQKLGYERAEEYRAFYRTT